METNKFITGYVIDENGFWIDSICLRVSDETPNEVVIEQPSGELFYKMKWTGTKWIEGATQEEIDELTKIAPSPPTQDERIKMLEDTINFLLEL